MTTYTLKLVSGVNYNLYNGTTLVSDSDLATMFGSAGSAFFVFDFDGGTPTNTTSLTIVDSNSQAVVANTGLSGIAENTNFNGDWSASATAFDTFIKSPAAVLDEAQMSDLMGKIKSATEINDMGKVATGATIDATSLLQSGIYKYYASGDAAFRLSSTWMENIGQGDIYFILPKTVSSSSTDRPVIAFYNNTNGNPRIISTTMGTNVNTQLYGVVIDHLTSNSTTSPLSAKQGKQLNTNIGDLTTLTTTAKTSAVAAINELHSNAALIGTTLSTPTNVAYVATANIQDGAVTPVKSSTYQHSTAERVVGQTISGDNIYERTISGTYDSLGAVSRKPIYLTSFSVGEVEDIISATGYIEMTATSGSSDTLTISINSTYPAGNGAIACANCIAYKKSTPYTSPAILTNNQTAVNGLEYYVTLRYTKVTD